MSAATAASSTLVVEALVLNRWNVALFTVSVSLAQLHCRGLMRGQAFAWDWLLSLSEELAVISRSQFRAPIVAYFLSR